MTHDHIAPPRTIAAGDIHGCAGALSDLPEQIEPRPEDTLITLGDYIDRGADSRGVIERLLALRGRCRLIPLKGNHEQMMLDDRDNPRAMPLWQANGGLRTILRRRSRSADGRA